MFVLFSISVRFYSSIYFIRFSMIILRRIFPTGGLKLESLSNVPRTYMWTLKRSVWSPWLSSLWWAQVDSNHRPHAYQACALTTWAMSPLVIRCISFLSRLWWRWWDSNPWPPACRAGALPTELHPHCLGFYFEFPFGHSKLNNKWAVLTSVPYLTSRLSWFCSTLDYEISQTLFADLMFSIERRWSSRTFRYGYLVTT